MSNRHRRWWSIVLAFLFAALRATAEPSDLPPIAVPTIDRKDPIDFEHEVLPALRDNCLACHNRTRSKADLILETPADIRKGGENGPAALPGKGADSLLFRVSAHLDKPAMPPRENKVSAVDLTPTQLALMKLWIDQGATGDVRGAASLQWQAPPAALRPIYAVAVTPDGRYAAAGRANRIDLYDLPARRLVATLADPTLGGAAHREFVESLAFSPDGNTLASGGFAEVKLWRRSPAAKRFTVAPSAGAGVRVVAVSADGTRLAAASDGWPIEIFDASTGRLTRTLDTSTATPLHLAFSPDGTRLAVASADRGVRVSSVADGRLIAQTVMPADVGALAWVDAKNLALGGADGVVRLWQADAPLRELKVGPPITALVVAGPDLICGGADGSVRRVTIADGKPSASFAHGAAVASFSLRADGKAIAVVGTDGSAKLWDLAKGTAVAELRGDATLIHRQADAARAAALATGDVAFAKAAATRVDTERQAAAARLKASATALATATKTATDKAAAIAAAKAAKITADAALAAVPERVRQLTAAAACTEAALRAARDRVDEAEGDGETPAEGLALLNAQLAEKTTALAAAKTALQATLTDPKPKQAADAAVAALMKAEGELPAADQARANAQTEQRLAEAADAKAAQSLAGAGQAIAVATSASSAADAQLAKATAAAKAAATPVRSVAFSADGSSLATVADDASVHLWSGETGQPLETIPVNVRPDALAFAGDRVLAIRRDAIDAWSHGGQWSLSRTIGASDGPLVDRVAALAFSPDGKRLATGSGEPTRSGKIALWDVATGRLEKDLKDPHSDSVLSLAFSRDGSQLASGGADRVAKVTDVANGNVVRSLEGHTGHVLGVAWRADGRALVTCGADGQVKIWDAATGDRVGAMGGFGKEVNAVSYLGVGGQLIEASADGQVRVCNEAMQNAKNLAGTTEYIHAMAVTPDGGVIVTGNDAGTLTVWRDPAAPPVATFAAPK